MQATGAFTSAGTWAASEAEAHYIEAMADADEKWDKLMSEGGSEWLNKPVQPPGMGRSGEKRGGLAMHVLAGIAPGCHSASGGTLTMLPSLQ